MSRLRRNEVSTWVHRTFGQANARAQEVRPAPECEGRWARMGTPCPSVPKTVPKAAKEKGLGGLPSP